MDSLLNITVTEVVAANRLLNSPVGVSNSHPNRERWAIALKAGGRTYYTVNGRQVVSDGQHPVIMPCGCSYLWKCVEPGECLIIEFDALETADDLFSFSLADNGALVSLFKQIQKCLSLQGSAWRLEARQLLYELLVMLAKSVKREYVSRDKQRILQTAVNYITEKYYDCTITNDFLASLCGISTVYFRKTFETVYGKAPIQYLHDLRMSKAKDILQSDYGSIQQVAESVGYNSIYHFSKMFKQYTGVSPSAYASSVRKGEVL